MDIKEEKSGIRKEIIRRRSSLSSKVLNEIERSLPAFISGIEDDELQRRLGNAKRIALYRSFNGEVPVDGLARDFMAKGIRCCFPRIENGSMSFFDCESLEDGEFVTSSIGIKEPAPGKPEASGRSIDVVVLPAVAYNEEGARLGMGGGYYDRYLEKYQIRTLGICYAACRQTALPHDATDRRLEACITEQKTEDFYG